MTKLIAISFAILALGLPAVANAGDDCLVPGTMAHWRADYCVSLVGTDDVIATQPCLEKERQILFRSSCTAKLHYKRKMCELSIRSSGAGSVEACIKDPLFQGHVVRNGGA
jgi:hypothetical protein